MVCGRCYEYVELEENYLKQCFHVYSRACVLVVNDVSKWFPVNVGLRQCYVMSPWLFNIYTYIWVVWFERRCGSRMLECLGNGWSC